MEHFNIDVEEHSCEPCGPRHSRKLAVLSEIQSSDPVPLFVRTLSCGWWWRASGVAEGRHTLVGLEDQFSQQFLYVDPGRKIRGAPF